MRGEARHVFALLATKRHGGTYNRLFVHQREIATGDDHLGEDHARVGREWPDVGLLSAMDRVFDPAGRDHGDHDGLRLGELLKVDRVGDYVGDLLDGNGAISFRLADGCSILP